MDPSLPSKTIASTASTQKTQEKNFAVTKEEIETIKQAIAEAQVSGTSETITRTQEAMRTASETFAEVAKRAASGVRDAQDEQYFTRILTVDDADAVIGSRDLLEVKRSELFTEMKEQTNVPETAQRFLTDLESMQQRLSDPSLSAVERTTIIDSYQKTLTDLTSTILNQDGVSPESAYQTLAAVQSRLKQSDVLTNIEVLQRKIAATSDSAVQQQYQSDIQRIANAEEVQIPETPGLTALEREKVLSVIRDVEHRLSLLEGEFRTSRTNQVDTQITLLK